MNSSVGNRIKKLYLIDEQQLKQQGFNTSSSSPLVAGNIEQQMTMPLSGGAPKSLEDIRTEQYRELVANPLSNPLEREVRDLDAKIEQVLKDKSLPPPMKILAYLRGIRKFIRLRDDLMQRERDGILPGISANTAATPPPSTAAAAAAVMGDLAEEVSPSGERGESDEHVPTSQQQRQRVQRLYADSNMLKNISPSMKSRFRYMLKQLKDNGNVTWDRSTGEVSIRGKPQWGTNISDLIVHKIKSDAQDPAIETLGGDEPVNYNVFNAFLTRAHIRSVKETKRQRVLTQRKQHQKKSGKAVAEKKLDPNVPSGRVQRTMAMAAADPESALGVKNIEKSIKAVALRQNKNKHKQIVEPSTKRKRKYEDESEVNIFDKLLRY